MKKALRALLTAFTATLMAIAPGLDLSVQPKVLPDATGFWDAVYQAVARTAAAVSTDRIALAALFAVSLWLCVRFLFRKPKRSGVGEIVLCLFLSVMMLLERAVRTDGSVTLLTRNAFQVLKSLLYLCGTFPLLLTALRGLNALLAAPLLRRGPAGLRRLWEKQTGKTVFSWLALCWLPHIVIKYPGVLMWDTYQQIKQFTGEYARIATHPPLGTLLYGWMYRLGEALGNVNYGYFLFMLAQVAAMLWVLSRSLIVMKRLGVSVWIRLGAFVLYAVSPCYVGWATVIGKDAMYLFLCLYLGIALIEFAHEGFPYLHSARKTVPLGAALALAWLTRYNGAAIAVVVLLAMTIAAAVRRAGCAEYVRIGALAAAVVIAAVGGNALLLRAMNIQKVYLFDTYSLPFQQTARVVQLHGADIPADEAAAINAVLDYDALAENYNPWYADAVKDTYRQTADRADRAAYLKVWLAQWVRYPADNLDALLNMNGVLFDLQFNRPMYVCLTDNTLSDTVYPYSFNDMTMYDAGQLSGLNAAQRMLTQAYFDFDSLPVLGWFAGMGFPLFVMLALLYLTWINGRRAALWVFIPSVLTALGCLFMPVVYLRYALPYVCSLPLWFAAYDAAGRSTEASAPAK